MPKFLFKLWETSRAGSNQRMRLKRDHRWLQHEVALCSDISILLWKSGTMNTVGRDSIEDTGVLDMSNPPADSVGARVHREFIG